MSREADIQGMQVQVITIPAGGTNAVLIPQRAGAVSLSLKYGSGGSLEILQAPPGVTLAGASLAAGPGTGYLFGTSEILNFSGQPRFYLCASSTQTIAYGLWGMGAGY